MSIFKFFFLIFVTATTRRVRPGQQDTKTSRRRQSSSTVNRRKNSTARRGSQYHEVQVAMLPDLSGRLHSFSFFFPYFLYLLNCHFCFSSQKISPMKNVYGKRSTKLNQCPYQWLKRKK